MTRVQIDLDDATAKALIAMAEQHNRKVKNLVECIVMIQVGTMQPLTVAPVQIPAKDTRQEVHREEPRKEQPKEKPEQKPRKEPTLEALEGITPRKKTALENAREPRQELLEQELRTEAMQEAKPWKPNRNDGDYKTKVSDRIYTDGTSYRINLFGSIHYFQTLAQAEEKRDK